MLRLLVVVTLLLLTGCGVFGGTVGGNTNPPYVDDAPKAKSQPCAKEQPSGTQDSGAQGGKPQDCKAH